MSDRPLTPDEDRPSHAAGRFFYSIGAAAENFLNSTSDQFRRVGGMTLLLAETISWLARGLFVPGVKLRRAAIAEQMVRVGVKSIGIVVLVASFMGCILALQMAPTLQRFGQLDRVAQIVAIAMVRELGPLLTAIVLSGFAGASIAAELGAMVESEEIKALRAHALNPVHFLVVPRFVATVVMIVGLAVIANIVGVLGGFLTSWLVLDIAPQTYLDLTREGLVVKDYVTGLIKAGVFGGLICLIACHEGMTVSGGAVGVGRATTATVVKSIVAIIGMDAVFTAVFYAFGL